MLFLPDIPYLASISSPRAKKRIAGSISTPHRFAKSSSSSRLTVKKFTFFRSVETEQKLSLTIRLGPQQFAKNKTAAYLDRLIFLSKLRFVKDFIIPPFANFTNTVCIIGKRVPMDNKTLKIPRRIYIFSRGGG